MALDFTSFNAMSLLNQGPLPCLLGNAFPATQGATLSTLDDTGFATITEQIEEQVSGNGFPIKNGHLLTIQGDGSTQFLIGYDKTTTGRTGLHASAFIRNKGSETNARWSEWAELLDSQNFTAYIATSQAGSAAQGTWNINITGNAETAKYLLPVTSVAAPQATYGAFLQPWSTCASYGLSSDNTLIWGEEFTDPSWTYTYNNSPVAYSSKGFIGYFLEPSPTSDNIKLNMLINGTYYGNFQGALLGNATSATRANTTTEENTLAYYINNIGTFSHTSSIYYLPNTQAEIPYLVNEQANSYGTITGLRIQGRGYAPNNRNRLLFGDAGPQIRFTDYSSTSDNKTGAIIYNRNANLSGFGASFSFVSGYKTNNTTISERNTAIITDGLIAHAQLGIGIETLDPNYQLEVHGNSYYIGEIKLGDATSATTAYLKYPFESRQHIVWANQNQTINDNIGLSNYGVGTYSIGTNLWYAIANATGINLFTDSNLTLMHNSMVIPNTGNTTGTVGTINKPVYVNQGVITPISYEIYSNVLSSAEPNRFAYFKLNVVEEEDENGEMQVVSSSIDIAQTTMHLINDSNVSFGSVSVIENYLLYVNGNSLFNGLTSFRGNVVPGTNQGYTLGQPNDGNHWGALFIGASDSYGTAEQPIYWNNGVPTVCTYALSATINSGTENRIAFYSSDTSISSGTIHTNGTYLSNVTNLTIGADHQADYLLDVEGNSLFHGDVLHNGIVYFANGNTYYINNSGDARLAHVGVGNADANSSYALNIGGNVYINGIHYFGNSTGYYINNSGNAYLNDSTILNSLTIHKDTTDWTVGAKLNFTVTMDNTEGSSYIAAYQTPTATTYNQSLAIVAKGNLFIGGGEGAETIHQQVSSGTGSEDLFLAADGSIKVYTGADDKVERLVIDSTPSIYPSTTLVGNIGTSSHKWNNVYSAYGYYYTDLWGDQVRLTDNWIGFYAGSVSSTTRYAYIQGSQNAVTIRSENNTSGTTATLSYNGNISPSANGAGSLGASGNRWSKLYIGSADTHGDAYTPIYWNAGAPTAVPPIQYTTWSIASGGTSTTITKEAYRDNTYVIAIIVTSGEANLNGAISWSSNNSKQVVLSTAKTSGAVSGYILTARGVAI